MASNQQPRIRFLIDKTQADYLLSLVEDDLEIEELSPEEETRAKALQRRIIEFLDMKTVHTQKLGLTHAQAEYFLDLIKEDLVYTVMPAHEEDMAHRLVNRLVKMIDEKFQPREPQHN